MRPPAFITFTGADDRTDLDALSDLAADFPVEFGILWSAKRRGEPRYPSSGFFDRLMNTPDLRLSLHICGRDAREIAAGRSAELWNLRGFQRVQINGVPGADADLRNVADFASDQGVRAILQSGSRDTFPDSNAVDWLFDLSGGRGALQDRWPPAPATKGLVGYAGGLGLETHDAFQAIARAAGSAPYWVDMEGKLRDEMDAFDVNRCRRICEAVYGCERFAAAA